MAIKNFDELSLLKMSFKNFESASNEMKNLYPGRDSIPHKDIEEILKVINRRFKFPLKEITFDFYTNDRIVLLGNQETVKVQLVLPAWLKQSQSENIVAYVNLTPYLSGNIDNINNRLLYGFMQYGASLILARKFDLKLSSSNVIAKEGSVLYARMMSKIFDRIASISIDKIKLDKIRYTFAKYFLINLMGFPVDSASIEIYAKGATTNTATENILNQFENNFAITANAKDQQSLYSLDLLTFISFLIKSTPWLSKITTRAFIQDFIALFNASSFLAMESFAYFLATMASLETGAEIIKSYSFEPLFGKEGEKVVAEFVRLIR